MKRKQLEPANKQISLRRQCALLGLSWSTYMFKPSKGEQWKQNEALNQVLKRQMDEYQLKYPWFGVESYHTWLEQHFQIKLNVKRIRRLMREMGLVSLAPGPHTSKPHPGHKTYPYLLRELAITYPNQVWCADITYLPMAKGHMYMVAIMDWYSRKILSWRISNKMEEGFCVEAFPSTFRRLAYSYLPASHNEQDPLRPSICKTQSPKLYLQVVKIPYHLPGGGGGALNSFMPP